MMVVPHHENAYSAHLFMPFISINLHVGTTTTTTTTRVVVVVIAVVVMGRYLLFSRF